MRIALRSLLRWIHPIVVFALAGVAGVSALTLHGAEAADPSTSGSTGASLGTIAPRSGLDDLTVLQNVLFQVEESYVEPRRIDYEAMFVAALESVEAGIPVVMFRREGRVLHMEVGQHRSMAEVPPIGTRRELQQSLEAVGSVLGAHLSPEDIPGEWREPYRRIEYALVNGALSTLDPHSRLLPPEEAREMDVDNDGQYGGVGITVEERDGRIVVWGVRPGDPADLAGVQVGDHITHVDGVSTMGVRMSDALQGIRGVPGSTVDLTMRRRGEQGRDITLTRSVIAPDAVTGEWLGDGVLYLSIPAFHDDVHAGLRSELSRAVKAHGPLKGVILDLRGNPGGYLRQAVAVSNAFLRDGTILSTVGVGDRREPPERAILRDTEPDYPLAVLVDADSASASEIVAGALRNNERAVIIGERSFGKGSVQNLWDYADGSKLKLTVGKYLTPGEISIQAVGIPADIETVPVVVADGDAEADLRVVWRDRVLREADLDRRLDRVDTAPIDPAYSVRYLVQDLDGEPDATSDPQVDLARQVIARARSPRRSEILAGVAPLVERLHTQQERAIVRALAEHGVDWSDHSIPQRVDLDVQLTSAGSQPLQAGETSPLTVAVRNDGEQPIPRLVAVTRSSVPALDGLEWVLGRLEPGERIERARSVRIPQGFGSADVDVAIELIAAGRSVAEQTESIAIGQAGLPALGVAWRWQDRGDGDGLAEAGEEWSVWVTVNNHGAGPTREPFVSLRTPLASPVMVLTPRVHPGDAQQHDLSHCEVETAGFDGHQWVGSDAAQGEPGYDPVVYAPGCEHVVSSGGSSEVRIDLRITDQRITDTPLELSFGDSNAYDVAAADELGVRGAWSNQTTLWLPVLHAPAHGSVHPPGLQTTLAPPSVVNNRVVTVSGLATDPDGLSHVQVLADDDKVFLGAPESDAEPMTAIPYTATVVLEPGLHRLTIVATDREGMVRTETHRVTVRPEPEVSASR